MQEHKIFMQRCVELARRGAGYAAPNPMVGSVVVHNGKIIGEGWHERCGEAHAEVNAISSVKDKSLLEESTIYVSLEPCSHYGKTPPCADLIIKSKIPHVVVGTIDTFSEVSGRGIERLRSKGIRVETGILGEECRELNKYFFTYHEKKRPFVILKWAETQDQFISRLQADQMDRSENLVSNPLAARFVHKIRSEVDGILVGGETARVDNPSLTTRFWSGENAQRFIWGKNLGNVQLKMLSEKGTTVILSEAKSPSDVISELYKQKVQSVLIEGGARVLQQFIDAGVWDEVYRITANIRFGEGVKAPVIGKHADEVMQLGNNRIERFVKF